MPPVTFSLAQVIPNLNQKGKDLLHVNQQFANYIQSDSFLLIIYFVAIACLQSVLAYLGRRCSQALIFQ